jgi:hypothetical protein
MNIRQKINQSIKRSQAITEKMLAANRKRTAGLEETVRPADDVRSQVSRFGSATVGANPNTPITPLPCSGTSFSCDVPGSGKTNVKPVNMYPDASDYLATPMQEGGMLNTKFQPDVRLNWQNSGGETDYTKKSLKDTYGFENFQ